MSLETPEPPQEIWLVYDWHGPWWEVSDQFRDDAVRYVRPPITTPEPQEHQVINGVDVYGFRIINCLCGWIGHNHKWEDHL